MDDPVFSIFRLYDRIIIVSQPPKFLTSLISSTNVTALDRFISSSEKLGGQPSSHRFPRPPQTEVAGRFRRPIWLAGEKLLQLPTLFPKPFFPVSTSLSLLYRSSDLWCFLQYIHLLLRTLAEGLVFGPPNGDDERLDPASASVTDNCLDSGLRTPTVWLRYLTLRYTAVIALHS